jgi:hypothetical protein
MQKGNTFACLVYSAMSGHRSLAGVRLTGQMRVFYSLRFIHGLTQCAIAQRLGITQASVSKRESRLRQRFRQAGLDDPEIPGRHFARVLAISL